MACGGSARYLLALIAYLATIATLTDGKIFTSLKLKDNTIILRANSGPLRDQINHLTARFRRDATPAKKNNNNNYNNNNNSITTSTMTVPSQPTATTTTEHRQQQENTNNNGENKNSDSNGPLESPDLSVPTPAAAASQTLITSFVNLPDWNHNEAIVHWSGNKSNVIFVLTRDHDPSGDVSDSTLWQSKDYGGTFHRINFTDEALIYYYFTSNVNHNKLIFTDVKNKQLFLTYNEAEQMIQVSIGFVPSRILMHPVQEDWVLGYDLKAGKLYSSLNFGLNWTLLHENVTPRFFWAIDGQDKSPATVHMELLDTIGQSLYLACLAPHCDIVTMDHSINPILPSSLVVQDEYVFVQKQHAESNKLYVSYQRGKFKMSHFPQNLHPQNFNILNTDEGQVFVAVHYKKDYINCYLSDPSGQFFVLTLENIVAVTLKGHFQVDLYQVKGLPGVYLANQEPKDMQLKESGRRTFISFDKGGNWSLIPVPKNLKSQCAADKKKECSLHLHLQQIETFFNVPRVLSDENAPGLILAHGTIGTGLSFRGVGVFITRDAGLTWYAAPFHGLHELNILDQGSAITALNASWKTREIYFTCNEGQDWQKHIFAKEDVYVDGVLNEPGINTLIVSIYAHKFPSKGWILIKANFSSILTRHCTSDDYESWTPVKHTINGCILGRKLTYERKKQFSECNNGRDYERPINITICQCTAEDFECDFGYEQKNGEDCQPAQWFDVNRPVFECPENQHFNKSRGYRKVGGDYCIGGVSSEKKYHHVVTKCPVIAPDGLQLLTAKPVVATQSVIKFNLIQATGSVLTTNYTIDFGDGTIKYYSGPSVLSNQLSHMYTHHGTFTVTATARNENGSSTATYVVHAEDEIEKFSVESLYGAQVQHPAIFNTDVRGHHLTASNIGNVHYVWHFGDEDFRLPLLTWEKNVSHVYTQPGTYIATIEAINSVSSAYVQIPIKVYSYIKRIQVTFSSNVDTINENNLEWRSWLKTQLQEKVADFLRINENRLIVFVHNDLPPKADVTLLPHDPLMVADENTDQLVEKLISSVRQEKLKIQWLDYTIKVTGASVKEERSNKRSRRNMLPIIIAAPVLALSLVIVIFVFLYYRRKFHHVQRYSFLQARDAADSLLEDDDDDPPLDPNPNFSHIEMTGEQTDAVGGGGLVDPVLVMMPGGLSQSNLTDPHALRC